MILFAIFAVPFVVLFLNWTQGNSVGVIPISDSAGYNSCLRALSVFGQLPDGQSDWCLRRPFYVLIMFPLYSIMGLKVFLFIQNIVWLLSIVMLRRTLTPVLSNGWRLALTFILMLSWMRFGATQTVTEALAIPLSYVALALFVRYKLSGSVSAIYSCLFLLSLSQTVRPGNIFLLLISTLYLAFCHRGRMQHSFLILVSGASWTLITYFIQFVRGDGVFGNASNFSATLYGLSVGNRTWTAAYSDYPPSPGVSESIYFSQIRGHAFHEILHSPFVFGFSLIKNVFKYIFSFGPVSPVNPSILLELLPIQLSPTVITGIKLLILVLISLLFFFALQYSKRRLDHLTEIPKLRSDFIPLAIIVTVSSIVSSSFLWADDGVRVLSPNLPWTLLIILLVMQKYFPSSAIGMKETRLSNKFRVPSVFMSIVLIMLASHGYRLVNSLDSREITSKDFPACEDGGSSRFLVHKEALILESPIKEILNVFWYSSTLASLSKGVVVSAMLVSDKGAIEDRTLFIQGRTIEQVSNSQFVCIEGPLLNDGKYSLGWDSGQIAP